MAGKFKYRGSSASREDVERRKNQYSGNYDSFIESAFPLLKVKEGENNIRILPATWPEADVERWGPAWDIQVQLHYGIGSENGTYLCLDKMKGDNCPICDARRDAEDQEEADALRPSQRALCWVIDRDNEKAGPQIWSMPATLFKDICGRQIDKKSGDVLQLDDPEQGFDISFSREGKDKRTKYVAVEVSRDPSPIHDNEKQQAKWIDYIMSHPLPDVLNYYDTDYIEKVLSGKKPKKEAAEDEVDENASDNERRDARRSAGTSRRTREPEETAEDDPPAERSSRSSRTTRRGEANGDGAEDGEERDTRRTSSRSSRREPEETDEVDETEDNPSDRRSARSSRREPEEETAEDDPPPNQARRGLEKLRERAAGRR